MFVKSASLFMVAVILVVCGGLTSLVILLVFS